MKSKSFLVREFTGLALMYAILEIIVIVNLFIVQERFGVVNFWSGVCIVAILVISHYDGRRYQRENG